MKLQSIVIAAGLLALLQGCGSKDTAEPPAELTKFDATLDVQRVWSTKVGGASERLRLGLRPATDGARVYAGAYDGKVASYDAATGREEWSVETELTLTAGPGFGDGLLVFGTADGDLLALDAANGQERWKQAIGSEVLAAPAIGRASCRERV